MTYFFFQEEICSSLHFSQEIYPTRVFLIPTNLNPHHRHLVLITRCRRLTKTNSYQSNKEQKSNQNYI